MGHLNSCEKTVDVIAKLCVCALMVLKVTIFYLFIEIPVKITN